MANVQDSAFASGRAVVAFAGTIARTDTAAKVLFTLPAGFVPTDIKCASPNNSDAGTTATISVGRQGGAQTDFINAQDVKTAATGKGSFKPVTSGSALLGVPLAAATVVTGLYAETGGASTTGGPFAVIVEGFVV